LRKIEPISKSSNLAFKASFARASKNLFKFFALPLLAAGFPAGVALFAWAGADFNRLMLVEVDQVQLAASAAGGVEDDCGKICCQRYRLAYAEGIDLE
jgi:hypothetical protein